MELVNVILENVKEAGFITQYQRLAHKLNQPDVILQKQLIIHCAKRIVVILVISILHKDKHVLLVMMQTVTHVLLQQLVLFVKTEKK